jgi:hypothetical protein
MWEDVRTEKKIKISIKFQWKMIQMEAPVSSQILISYIRKMLHKRGPPASHTLVIGKYVI